jgi:outer membrane protein OmpA-like peptidoglycan-associated protein
MLLNRFHPNRLLALLLLAVVLAGCQTAPKSRLTDAQIAVLREQGFQLNDEGWELGLSSKVLFGNDVDTINETSKPDLERVGRALLGVDIDTLRLEGHTDSYGTPDYNRDLSLRRAQSVAQVLIDIGMQAGNLQVLGLGMDKPVADNKTASGRLENRRVSIIVPAQ